MKKKKRERILKNEKKNDLIKRVMSNPLLDELLDALRARIKLLRKRNPLLSHSLPKSIKVIIPNTLNRSLIINDLEQVLLITDLALREHHGDTIDPLNAQHTGERRLCPVTLRLLHDVVALALIVNSERQLCCERHAVTVDTLQETATHAKGDSLGRVALINDGLDELADLMEVHTVTLDDAHTPRHTEPLFVDIGTERFVNCVEPLDDALLRDAAIGPAHHKALLCLLLFLDLRKNHVERMVIIVRIHHTSKCAITKLLNHVLYRHALGGPRCHHRVLGGRNRGRHRTATVELKLDIVTRRHSVAAIKAQEMCGSANHRLLGAAAAAESKVVEAGRSKEVSLGVHALFEPVVHELAHHAAQGRHAARVPDLCKKRLHEGAEVCVLFAGSDLEHRDVHMCAGTLLEGLEANGEVTVVLIHKFVEKVGWVGEWCVVGPVRLVEELGLVYVLVGPLTLEVLLDDVADAVEHKAVVVDGLLGRVVAALQVQGCAELAIGGE